MFYLKETVIVDGRLSSDGGGVSSRKNGHRYWLKHRHRKRDSQRVGKTRWVAKLRLWYGYSRSPLKAKSEQNFGSFISLNKLACIVQAERTCRSRRRGSSFNSIWNQLSHATNQAYLQIRQRKSYYGGPVGSHKRSFERYHPRPPTIDFLSPRLLLLLLLFQWTCAVLKHVHCYKVNCQVN